MHRFIYAFVFGLTGALLHLCLFVSPWGQSFERAGTDFWFPVITSMGENIAPPPDIALLAMDDSSYELLGVPYSRPWPRSLHARAIRNLKALGARRVVFDVIFHGNGESASADEELEEAIRSMPVVIGADIGVLRQGSGRDGYLLEHLIEPFAPFARAAEKTGLVTMPVDFGVVRRFSPARSRLNAHLPQLYQAAVGVPHTADWLPGERDMVWYYGPAGTIPAYPYHSVILDSEKIPPDRFKNRIVFVGLYLRAAAGPAQKDMFQGPFPSPIFGVEIQATAAANLLQERWLRRTSPGIESGILCVLAFGLSLLVFRVRPQWGLLVILVAVLSWGVIAWYSMLSQVFIPGMLLVGIILPLMYMLSTLLYYLVTYRAQQQVERAFRLYLPGEMAREMRSNRHALELGGEEVVATAMFTDISGFTDISEKMPPSNVASMLNAYFTEVLRVVFNHKGTLLKFIGDSVFVIWGAPIRDDDDAAHACECARAIEGAVVDFAEKSGFRPLHTRVGLHTGRMLVGNLGARDRFDYTAIGDAVNLASRIEGLNRHFGTNVLISEATFSAVKDLRDAICMGDVHVSGRREPVRVYGFVEGLSIVQRNAWDQALEAFRFQDWSNSENLFTSIRNECEFLTVAGDLYLREISRIGTEGVSKDWKGVISFSGK